MSRSLKILHLEDIPDDAEMVARALKKGGIAAEILNVDTKAAFINALKEFSPDIILSDHSLPSFDSHEALTIVKSMNITIPFILITATVSEEYAVSIIKEGAADYILKDRLQRLPNAITSVLEKYSLEAARKLADEKLRASERKYKLLFESNPMPMWMISGSTLAVIAVNEAAVNHYGYTEKEFLQLNVTNLSPGEDIDQYMAGVRNDQPGNFGSKISRHKRKDGTIIMAEIISHDVVYANKPARLVLANDVTQKLQAEADLAQQRLLQQKLITETTIQVQEREREEIGKELHDNINQILATSKLYLQEAIKRENLQSSELLQRSRENIDLAMQEIRKLSRSLVVPSLGDITLLQAIEELSELINLTGSMQLELDIRNYNEEEVDKNINLTLYRIIQEQVNNIIKHSQAKNALIRLEAAANHIQLIVQDNGIGFDSSKAPDGIGLRNITTRARFYDGTATVISSPGTGFSLEVVIPLR